MKTYKLTSAIAATALMLPIAAWGQSSSTDTPREERIKEQRAEMREDMHENREDMRENRAEMREDMREEKREHKMKDKEKKHTATYTTSSADSFASSGQIQKIEREDLEKKATANNLTGKTVVGADGERIGTVHDIDLASVLPSELQMVTEDGEEDIAVSSSSPSSVAGKKEVTIFVSVGGVLGMGSNIVAVPASSFSYDAENDQLRLNQGSDEIERIANADNEAEAAAAAE